LQPKRIYFVKFNLDEFSASLAEYEEDTHALGLWLRGYKLGAYGLPIRPDAEPARAKGHAFGLKANQEAAEYAKSRSDNGKHGGRPKNKKPYGKHMESICKPHEKHTANHTESILKANEQPATSNEQPPESIEQRQETSKQPVEDSPEKILACLQQRGCIMRVKGQDVSSEWLALLIDFPSWNGRLIFDTIKENGFRKPIWLSDVREALEAKVSNQPEKSMYPNLNDPPPQPTPPPTNGEQP
jgi:hypothetical protein